MLGNLFMNSPLLTIYIYTHIGWIKTRFGYNYLTTFR